MFFTPTFCMIFARWNSMVRGLTDKIAAASLLVAPLTIWASTERSRGVRAALPGNDFDKTPNALFNILISSLACLSSGVSRNSHSP